MSLVTFVIGCSPWFGCSVQPLWEGFNWVFNWVFDWVFNWVFDWVFNWVFNWVFSVPGCSVQVLLRFGGFSGYGCSCHSRGGLGFGIRDLIVEGCSGSRDWVFT